MGNAQRFLWHPNPFPAETSRKKDNFYHVVPGITEFTSEWLKISFFFFFNKGITKIDCF